jgi:hypothetical protein
VTWTPLTSIHHDLLFTEPVFCAPPSPPENGLSARSEIKYLSILGSQFPVSILASYVQFRISANQL